MEIEKVPRDIQVEKSSKDMASSSNLVSSIGAQANPKRGTEPDGMPHTLQFFSPWNSNRDFY